MKNALQTFGCWSIIPRGGSCMYFNMFKEYICIAFTFFMMTANGSNRIVAFWELRGTCFFHHAEHRWIREGLTKIGVLALECCCGLSDGVGLFVGGVGEVVQVVVVVAVVLLMKGGSRSDCIWGLSGFVSNSQVTPLWSELELAFDWFTQRQLPILRCWRYLENVLRKKVKLSRISARQDRLLLIFPLALRMLDLQQWLQTLWFFVMRASWTKANSNWASTICKTQQS